MSTPITPAGVLRLAQAVPETAENFPVLRELIHALKDLVEITKDTKWSEQCAKRECIDCDGTQPATDVPGWWDPCACQCHPEAAS